MSIDITDEQLVAEIEAGATADAVLEGDDEPANDEQPAEVANDETGDAPAEGEEPEAPPADPAPEAEPEVDDKALAAIERRESASRAKLAKEREEMQSQLQQQAQDLEQKFAQQYPADLLATAKELRQLGIAGGLDKPEGMMALARAAYARAKAGEGDPRYADQAAQLQHKHEVSSEIQQLRAQNEQLMQRFEEAENSRRADAWLSKAETAADDSTPLIKKWVAADREEAHLAILREAARLRDEYGEVPSHKDVLTSLEKRRRAEFEKFGINVEALTRATPKTPAPAASKTPAAISRDLGTSTQTASGTRSLDELERELIAELDEGRAR
jgi:hypothetical protein